MTYTKEELDLAMNQAKVTLMSTPDSVFFTTLCFSLRHLYDDRIPTACTNGRTVRYSPAFFMPLTKEERVFLMLHETLHVAYFHVDASRKGSRDARKWNIAGDHVINLQLIERGFKMPKGGLADPQFKGLSTEQVYDLLPDDDSQPQMDDLEMSGDEGEGDKTLQQEIQDALIRAVMQSQMSGDKPGTVPGDIEIFLQKLLHPKLPWQTLLRKYLQNFAKSDYSFHKPNRRFFPRHILPGLRSEALIDMVFAIDTSGSVSDHEFHYFVTEAASLMRMMKPKKLTLIQFDWGIRAVDEIHSVEDLMKVEFTGRGGTDIREVIQWAGEHKPQLLMFFTDGEFNMPALETKSNLLWFIHNNPNFTAPKGKVIHYEIQK